MGLDLHRLTLGHPRLCRRYWICYATSVSRTRGQGRACKRPDLKDFLSCWTNFCVSRRGFPPYSKLLDTVGIGRCCNLSVCFCIGLAPRGRLDRNGAELFKGAVMRLFKLFSGKVKTKRRSSVDTSQADAAAEVRAKTNRAEITRLFQRELLAKKAGDRVTNRQMAAVREAKSLKKGSDGTMAL